MTTLEYFRISDKTKIRIEKESAMSITVSNARPTRTSTDRIDRLSQVAELIAEKIPACSVDKHALSRVLQEVLGMVCTNTS
jgi:hypothetical protein